MNKPKDEMMEAVKDVAKYFSIKILRNLGERINDNASLDMIDIVADEVMTGLHDNYLEKSVESSE